MTMELAPTFLACPSCGLDIDAAAEGRCRGCGESWELREGIPCFIAPGAATALDGIDYDAVYRIDAEGSRTFVSSCLAVLSGRLPDRIDAFLEVGAGTGGFTLGFLSQVPVRSALLTDISPSMLQVCRRRLEENGLDGSVRLDYAAWDGTGRCFRDGAFDLVAGFSVLHHVLDYATMLGLLQKAMSADGTALFLEPNYRFHCVMFDMVSDIYAAIEAGDGTWTSDDLRRLGDWLLENNTNLRFRGDDHVLSGQEDKHSFEAEDMREVARAVGFADAELLPLGGRTECWSAMTVYAAQIGLADAAREDLLRRYSRLLPGPFAHLADEDRAPSSLILFHNRSRRDAVPAQGTRERFTFPELEGCRVHHDFSVALSADRRQITVQGWILGDMDLNYLLLRAPEGQTLRFPIVGIRSDVHAAFNAKGTFPTRRSLFSGLSRSPQPVEPLSLRLEAVAQAACGREFPLGTVVLNGPDGSARLASG